MLFFKQKTAYEMRISDSSSDVCSSDLRKASRALSMASLVALTSLVTAEPAFAHTNLESFGNAVLGLLSNGLLRIVAILALIAAGFGWLTGRVHTGPLVTVIIGVAYFFSAAWVVVQLQGLPICGGGVNETTFN